MAALFGTDGIRGVAGQHPLDADTIYRTGLCLAQHLKAVHAQPHILIARDTRRSGPWIEALLRCAIRAAGGIAEICGVTSTPAVSLLTMARKAHAGIMISASHNPYHDNGIKVFSSEGMKFNDVVEEELEGAILSCRDCAPPALTEEEAFRKSPDFTSVPKYLRPYTRYLLTCLPRRFHLGGMRLVVDCAHGSLSAIAPAFLRSLGARVHPLHCAPDGCNINHHAGALHLERLQHEVVRRKAHLGIAFDGDADRAMFVDSRGRTHDGDDVLYILARFLRSDAAPRTVVGTVMANLGLEIALQQEGFLLVRTAVGDRNVLEEMLRLDAILGGEQSGHIIMAKLARTGDGLLTALKILEALVAQKKDIAELCRAVERFPQILLNVPVREKLPLAEIPGLAQAEAECRELLGPRSRILIRYSGTEKLARVMVEGSEAAVVRQAATRLASIFQK